MDGLSWQMERGWSRFEPCTLMLCGDYFMFSAEKFRFVLGKVGLFSLEKRSSGATPGSMEVPKAMLDGAWSPLG